MRKGEGVRGTLRGAESFLTRARAGKEGEGGTTPQISFKITYNSSHFYVILRGALRGGQMTAGGGLSGKHIETTI